MLVKENLKTQKSGGKINQLISRVFFMQNNYN